MRCRAVAAWVVVAGKQDVWEGRLVAHHADTRSIVQEKRQVQVPESCAGMQPLDQVFQRRDCLKTDLDSGISRAKDQKGLFCLKPSWMSVRVDLLSSNRYETSAD